MDDNLTSTSYISNIQQKGFEIYRYTSFATFGCISFVTFDILECARSTSYHLLKNLIKISYSVIFRQYISILLLQCIIDIFRLLTFNNF